MEGGGNGEIATDLRELADDRHDSGRGRPALIPRRRARDTQLRVHPALPVPMHDGLGRLRRGVAHHGMQNRTENAFFERFGGCWMLPEPAEVLPQGEYPDAAPR